MVEPRIPDPLISCCLAAIHGLLAATLDLSAAIPETSGAVNTRSEPNQPLADAESTATQKIFECGAGNICRRAMAGRHAPTLTAAVSLR